MKFGFFISLAAHGVALYGGLALYKGELKPLEETRIIPIDIVSIAEVTNVKAAIKPPKPVPKPPEPEPEPEPMTLETPMVNAPEEGEVQERVEEQAPEPVKVAEALPEPEAEVIDIPEEPPAEPEPPKTVDLDRLAGLVNRVREQAPERNQQVTLQSEVNNYVFADQSQAGVGEGTAMTISELDALQSAMYKCWSIPAAAPDPAALIVPVKVSLFPDGYVNTVKLGSFKEIDHFHRLAADEAIRAVNKCQPYDFLPEEKYSQWREMTLNFRPDV